MKSLFTLIGVFLLFTMSTFAQVGIGIETPDASSILHLESTNAGLLLPRLDETQRDGILSPARGLVIYNTTADAIEINTSIDPAVPAWSILDTVDDTKPVLAPSVTTPEMNALPTTVGSLVFNTTANCLFQYKTGGWQSLCEAESAKIVTLYKNLNGASNSITSANTSSNFTNFPLGSSEVTEIDSDYFTVTGNGQIQVLKAGSYLISGSLSVQNLLIGTHKYILAVFRNGTRIGYLARGFSTIPSGVSGGADYFGTSGTFQYKFNQNDVISVQYLLDNGSSNMKGDLLHIGMVKL